MRSGTYFLIVASLVLFQSCSGTTDANDQGDSTSDDPPVESTTYSLSTSVTPADGGSVDPSSGDFEEGTDITMEAASEAGFVFKEWQGDASGTENPVTITMNSDKDITAVFEPVESNTYSLSTSVTPADGGTVDPSSGDFDEGADITIEAASEAGFVFKEWQGDVSGTENPVTITMNSDKEITAVFEPITYSLSTSVNPADGGTINPSSGEFEVGSDITMEAVSEAGFAFKEWQGDVIGTENPVTITMDSDKEITALFDDIRSVYQAVLTFKGTSDELNLEFGQSQSPGDSLKVAPPAPPEGAMHAWFSKGDEELFVDYRDWLNKEAEWELHFQPGEAASYTLSWSLDITRMVGSLTLRSEIFDDEIDMNEATSVEFTAEEPIIFTIVNERGQ